MNDPTVARLQASREKAAAMLPAERREHLVQYLTRHVVDQIDDILQMAYLTGRQDALTEIREQTLARIDAAARPSTSVDKEG